MFEKILGIQSAPSESNSNKDKIPRPSKISSEFLEKDHKQHDGSFHNRKRLEISNKYSRTPLVPSLQSPTSSKTEPLRDPFRLARSRSHRSFQPLKDHQPVLSRSSKRKIQMGHSSREAQLNPKKHSRKIRRYRSSKINSYKQRFCMLSRYKISLPSHKYPKIEPRMAKIRRQRKIFQISKSSLWSSLSTSNMVQSIRTTHRTLARRRYHNNRLHGRHLDLPPMPPNVPRTNRKNFIRPKKSRDLSEFREILPHPKTKNSSPRLHMGHKRKSHSTPRIKDPRHIKTSQVFAISRPTHPKRNCKSKRKTGSRFSSFPSLAFQEASSRQRSTRKSEKKQLQLERDRFTLASISKNSQIPSKQDPPAKIQRPPTLPTRSSMGDNNRRFANRLGSLSSPQAIRKNKAHQRSMVRRGEPHVLKLERNLSPHLRPNELQVRDPLQPRTVEISDGQHDSALLPPQIRRRNSIAPSRHRPVASIHHQTRPSSHISSHTRRSQHRSGPAISIQEKGPRLSSRLLGLRNSREKVRATLDRSFRISDQLANEQICELVPRSTSMLQRRVLPLLGQRECLCIPSDPVDKESIINSSKHDLDMLHHSHSSELAQGSMVAQHAPHVDPSADTDFPLDDHHEQSRVIREASLQNGFHSLSALQQETLSSARSFIITASSPSVSSNREKSYQAFQTFLTSHGLTEDAIGLIRWLQVKIIPSTSSAQVVQTKISYIDVSRRLKMLPSLQNDPLVAEFKKAIRKKLPRKLTSSFLDIFKVLQTIRDKPCMPAPTRFSITHNAESFPISFAPSDAARLRRNRLRCLILTRSVALLRSVDCASIIRSSITTRRDLASRTVVTFEYRGKAASIHSINKESNYLEFLPNDPDLCPASAMLILKDQVDSLNTNHDFLFCSEKKPHKNLTKERCSSIVRDFLRSIGIIDQRAHSIRKASNELLRLNGVPGSDRDARGGWKPKNSEDSPTQRLHYSYRMSSLNFAEVISRALDFNRSQDKN